MDGTPRADWDGPPTVGDELQPGTSLCQGQYTVVRYINAGGFGVTYLALDSLGRKVVIKECYPGALCCRARGTVRLRSTANETDFDSIIALFEREARALAQLEHPNIVGVHQIFKENGTAYMAMDFVEGPDLFEIIETQPERLTPKEVTRILKALLKALSFVHEQGILHRDISPDNILMAPGGIPVLIDFGAAREGAARATRVLSRIHAVKDGYSPQEFYLAGSSQEKSSDLYALAATVHHLIVGCPPPNSNIRLAAVAQDEADPYAPLLGRYKDYDESFLAAIDRCLSLFSKDRLRSAEEWLACIESGALRARPGEGLIGVALEQRIAEIVTETRAYIEEEQSKVVEVEEDSADAPDPMEEKRAAERAYWAILNEDPEEIRAEVERAQALLQDAEAFDDADHAEAPDAARRRFGGWLRGLFISRRGFGGATGLQTLEE
jgi:serine/threonine protein kinase